MKHFFTGSVPQPESDAQLSVEEEAILIDEISGCEADVQQTADELHQSVDLVQGMEDMLVVADSMDDVADQPTASLAVSFSEMATAGTDMEPDALIQDPSLSAESIDSIKESIKQIWASIVQAVKRLWGHIAALFNRYRYLFKNYIDHFTELKQEFGKLKTSGARRNGEPISVKGQATYDRGFSGQTRSPRDWLDNIERINVLTRMVLKTARHENEMYAEYLIEFVDEVHRAMAQPVYVGNDSRNTAFDKVGENFLNKIIHAKSEIFDASRQHSSKGFFGYGVGDAKVTLIDDLPNGYTLTFNGGYIPDTNRPDEDNQLNLIRELTHGHYKFSGMNMNRVETYVMPSPDEVITMIDKLLFGLTCAMDYLVVGKSSLEHYSDRIQKKIDEAVRSFNANGSSGVETRDYMNVVMRLGKHFNLTSVGLSQEVLSYLRKQYSAHEDGIESCLKTLRNIDSE